MSTAERIRLPDDCTVGYIVEALLGVPLIRSGLFHSHLENLQQVPASELHEQVRHPVGMAEGRVGSGACWENSEVREGHPDPRGPRQHRATRPSRPSSCGLSAVRHACSVPLGLPASAGARPPAVLCALLSGCVDQVGLGALPSRSEGCRQGWPLFRATGPGLGRAGRWGAVRHHHAPLRTGDTELRHV